MQDIMKPVTFLLLFEEKYFFKAMNDVEKTDENKIFYTEGLAIKGTLPHG